MNAVLAKPLHICLIAGEPSGDALGAALMTALKAQPGIIFSGVGGAKMQEEGLKSLFPIDDLAVMGIAEIIPKLTSILEKINQTAAYIELAAPDIVVSIDSPDFCFRVLKKLRRMMGSKAPKLIHYVAPTVWAWRPGRAKKIAGFLDGLICLFDFEPPYFEAEGLKSIAVGHPVVESEAMTATGALFRKTHNIPEEARVMGVLFGSRRGELKRHGQIFRDVMATVPGGTYFIVPTLPHLKPAIESLLAGLDMPAIITTDKAEKWQAFSACNAALAVSGTVGLELAATRVPHVIAYRTSRATYEMVRRMVKVKYAHLLNIMLDAPIIPEFLQDECRAERIGETLIPLITEDNQQVTQRAAFDIFARRIGADDDVPPSEKAAHFILSFKP